MTEREALYEARKRAKRHNREYFIVWSVEEHDLPGHHFHPSDEYDLEAFYLGCDPIAAIQPDGTVEASR